MDRLPDELRHGICLFASQDVSTINALCRTSKVLYTVALPLLYRHPTFKLGPGHDDSNLLNHTLAGPGMHHIRRLTINHSCAWHRRNSNRWHQRLCTVLKALPTDALDDVIFNVGAEDCQPEYEALSILYRTQRHLRRISCPKIEQYWYEPGQDLLTGLFVKLWEAKSSLFDSCKILDIEAMRPYCDDSVAAVLLTHLVRHVQVMTIRCVSLQQFFPRSRPRRNPPIDVCVLARSFLGIARSPIPRFSSLKSLTLVQVCCEIHTPKDYDFGRHFQHLETLKLELCDDAELFLNALRGIRMDGLKSFHISPDSWKDVGILCDAIENFVRDQRNLEDLVLDLDPYALEGVPDNFPDANIFHSHLHSLKRIGFINANEGTTAETAHLLKCMPQLEEVILELRPDNGGNSVVNIERRLGWAAEILASLQKLVTVRIADWPVLGNWRSHHQHFDELQEERFHDFAAKLFSRLMQNDNRGGIVGATMSSDVGGLANDHAVPGSQLQLIAFGWGEQFRRTERFHHTRAMAERQV